MEAIKDLITAAAAVACVAILVLGPVSCYRHETEATAAVVSKSSDPIAARCAMGSSETLKSPTCAVAAARK